MEVIQVLQKHKRVLMLRKANIRLGGAKLPRSTNKLT